MTKKKFKVASTRLFFSVTGVVNSPATNGYSNGPRSAEQTPQPVRQDSDSNVIRVPKGPDGTRGFSQR
jgi:hypothetical protein